MKKRYGFVSNSSSSSFIVFNDESLIPSGIKYVELNNFHKSLLLSEGIVKNIKPGDRIFLTQFISDCDDRYLYLWGDPRKKLKPNIIEYNSGGHGGPYDEDEYL